MLGAAASGGRHMRRRTVLAVVCLLLFCCLPVSGPTSSHSSSYHSSSKATSAGKTEHVNGYIRKDGTYVHGYDRHPSWTAPSGGTTSSFWYNKPADTLSYTPFTKSHTSDPYVLHPSITYDKHGKIKRSEGAKNAFKREHPCPSNGHGSGSCPGYVIDHVRPLECGGTDDPSNMQWQTVAEGKAKDKMERYCR